MRRSTYLVCVGLLLSSCGTTVRPWKPSPPSPEQELPALPPMTPEQQKTFEKVDAHIKEIKGDRCNYWGDALVRIEDSKLDQAKSSAETRAREGLAQSIRVRVKSTFYDHTKLKRTEEGSRAKHEGMIRSEECYKLDEEVSSKAETYTDVLLPEVRVESFLGDYRPGFCYAIAYVSKATYKEEVDKRIQEEMKVVRGPIVEGLKALRHHRHSTALRQFLSAHRRMAKLFRNMTFYHDLDNDGKDDDVGAFVNAQIRSLLTQLHIEPALDTIDYDVKGGLLAAPVVRVLCVPDQPEPRPVPKILLRATVQPTSGQLESEFLETKADGTAAIKLRCLDGNVRTATLLVELGEDLPDEFTRPFCTITLRRLPVVCLGVAGDGAVASTSQHEVRNRIRMIMGENRLEVLDFSLQESRITETDVSNATRRNADYLFAVTLCGNTGEDAGLPYGEAWVEAVMRDLTTGSEALTISLEPQRRYGQDSRKAVSAVLPGQIEAMLAKMEVGARLVALYRQPTACATYTEQKKLEIVETANRAAKNIEAGDVVASIDELLAGQQQLDAVLPNETFRAEVSGTRCDVRGWLARQLRSIVQSIEVKPERPAWEYGRNGEPDLYPRVIARAGDRPVPGLPLEAVLAKGQGNVEAKAVTDNNGLATVIVRRIAPPCREAVVVVRINKPIPSPLRRPPCRLVLRRRQVVRLKLAEGIRAGPVEEVLRTLGFVPVSGKEMAADADFELAIVVDSSTPTKAEGIFSARVSASIEMASLDGEKAFSSTIGPEKGYGTKAETAIADALVRVRKKIPDVLSSALQEK